MNLELFLRQKKVVVSAVLGQLTLIVLVIRILWCDFVMRLYEKMNLFTQYCGKKYMAMDEFWMERSDSCPYRVTEKAIFDGKE